MAGKRSATPYINSRIGMVDGMTVAEVLGGGVQYKDHKGKVCVGGCEGEQMVEVVVMVKANRNGYLTR
jgi:hypothetical protein